MHGRSAAFPLDLIGISQSDIDRRVCPARPALCHRRARLKQRKPGGIPWITIQEPLRVSPLSRSARFPRPLKLQQAYADYDAKKITKDQLEKEQNAAVEDTLKRFEATGSPIITDGEQRVSSFATYPIADTLAGSGLAPHLAPGGQYFAIFADGHNRQLPKLTGGPFHYNFYAGELVKKAVKMTKKPLHQAVIAPSMMYLLYPLDGDLPGYSRQQFEHDIVNEV